MVLGRSGSVVAIVLLLAIACEVDASAPSPSHNAVSGTWSIVAVDVDAAEVGVALATCLKANLAISPSIVDGSEDGVGRRIYSVFARTRSETAIELARLLPGYGVIVAQARVDRQNSDRVDRAAARLMASATAEEVIEAATSADPLYQTRQYGVVTMALKAASFTGNETFGWSGAATEQSVSVQGNILVGPEVVDAALGEFREAMKLPEAALSDALVSALEAGALQGGDQRCPREQAAL